MTERFGTATKVYAPVMLTVEGRRRKIELEDCTWRSWKVCLCVVRTACERAGPLGAEDGEGEDLSDRLRIDQSKSGTADAVLTLEHLRR